MLNIFTVITLRNIRVSGVSIDIVGNINRLSVWAVVGGDKRACVAISAGVSKVNRFPNSICVREPNNRPNVIGRRVSRKYLIDQGILLLGVKLGHKFLYYFSIVKTVLVLDEAIPLI